MYWTQDKELELITMIKNNINVEDIAKTFDKSKHEIELRLGKIIHENLKGNKTIDIISKLINMSNDKIVKYDCLYKDNKKADSVDNKIDKLEKENKLLKLIIENEELKKKAHL